MFTPRYRRFVVFAVNRRDFSRSRDEVSGLSERITAHSPAVAKALGRCFEGRVVESPGGGLVEVGGSFLRTGAKSGVLGTLIRAYQPENRAHAEANLTSDAADANTL